MIVASDIGDDSQAFVVIGTVWAKPGSNGLYAFEQKVLELRQQQKCWSSMQWKKNPDQPRILDAYKMFIDSFLSTPEVNFSCIVLDADRWRTEGQHLGRTMNELKATGTYLLVSRAARRYCDADQEIQLLLDRGDHRGRTISIRDRIARHLAQNAPNGVQIAHIHECNIRISPLLQLADILVGAVSHSFNATAISPEKAEIVAHIERNGNVLLANPTPIYSTKINIWKWAPRSPTPPGWIEV